MGRERERPSCPCFAHRPERVQTILRWAKERRVAVSAECLEEIVIERRMEITTEKQEWNRCKIVEGDRVALRQRMIMRQERAFDPVCEKLAAFEVREASREIEEWMTHADIELTIVESLRLLWRPDIVNRKFEMPKAHSGRAHDNTQ